MATTSTVPTPQVSQADSATIPSLVVTNFFNNATPSLAKLADLSAFAQVQFSYYSSLGVGKPLLGPYEAIGRAFAEEASFQTKYGSLGSNFVATAYQDVFGRAAGAEQVAHFKTQVDYFVSIYVKAGISPANALSYAQGAVIGQMLGHAVTEGGSVFDYAGAAKAYIAQMDTAGFVPGRPLSNFGEGGTVTPPVAGGGGGGGGTPPVDPLVAIKAEWLVLDAAYVSLANALNAANLDSGGIMFNNGAGGYSNTSVLANPIYGQTTAGAAAEAINKAVTNLAIRYADHLDKGGGTGDFTTFLAKDIPASGRKQSLHDNLLWGANPDAIRERNYDSSFQSDSIAKVIAMTIPFENRPYASGNTDAGSVSNLGKVKAFDFANGLSRSDYVTNKSAAIVDKAGQFGDTGMLWFNYNAAANTVSGNTSGGFAIGRHDGLGIEVGLKVKERGGPDVVGTLGSDGAVHYRVDKDASPSAANRADWNFDFSVLTGLNGRSETLNDYSFKLLIDTDKSAATSFQTLKLTQNAPGITPWIDPTGRLTGFINDDDGFTAAGSASRSQNSVNFGFDFLKNIIDADGNAANGTQPYDYRAGQFDIKLIAENKTTGVQLVGAHIVVHVDGMGLVP